MPVRCRSQFAWEIVSASLDGRVIATSRQGHGMARIDHFCSVRRAWVGLSNLRPSRSIDRLGGDSDSPAQSGQSAQKGSKKGQKGCILGQFWDILDSFPDSRPIFARIPGHSGRLRKAQNDASVCRRGTRAGNTTTSSMKLGKTVRKVSKKYVKSVQIWTPACAARHPGGQSWAIWDPTL